MYTICENMLRKVVLLSVSLFVAFFVLTASIFKSAAVVYDFNEGTAHFHNGSENVLGDTDVNIDYMLAYPGKILPDHFLWPMKAFRDRVWLILTTNDSREAELLLLLADKRLTSAKIVFEKGDPELGYTVLTKSEKYLERASQKEISNRQQGIDTSVFLERLARGSLKHMEIIREVSEEAPEDAKPTLQKLEEIPLKTYEKAMHALNEKGLKVPENPFNR